MNYQYTPYIWALLVSAVVTGTLAAYAWRRRSVSGAMEFVAAMLAIVVWSLANALEMTGVDLSTKLFWANVQYLSYASLPVLMLCLAFQYTSRARWLLPGRLPYLFVIPLLTIGLVWTNELHGLMRLDVHLDMSGPFPTIAKTYGPWFWVHTAYSYLLSLAAVFLFFDALLHSAAAFRGQPLTLLIGLLLPLLANLLSIVGFRLIHNVDPTPVTFSLAGAVLAWGLFRHRLFRIVPVAHDKVIESMSDGVIVLNSNCQVIDLSPAAQLMLGCSSNKAIGQPAARVLGAWPEFLTFCSRQTTERAEFVLDSDSGKIFVEVHASQLSDGYDRAVGRVIVLHDITGRKLAEEALGESERRYRELVDLLPEVIFETDLTGRLTFVNQNAFQHFHYGRDAVEAGLTASDLLAPEDRERGRADVAAVLAGAPTQTRECTVLGKDGSPIPAVIAFSRIMRGVEPVGMRGFLVDVAENKRLQSRLLEQQRSLATLEERERLAGELHNSTGQVFGFIDMQAQAIRDLISKGQNDSVDTRLDRLAVVAQDAHADVREYIHGVKTFVTREQHLLAALAQYLCRFGESYGLRTELLVPEEAKGIELGLALEVQLMRIIQDALANVRKHASARSVRIVFSVEDGRVGVSVEDDGRGVDTAENTRGEGERFGLRIMQERARGLGGSLEVLSAPGRGTRVNVQIPLPEMKRPS